MFLGRGGTRCGDAAPQLSFCPFLVIATCATAGAGQTADCYASWYIHTHTHTHKSTKVHANIHLRVHLEYPTHCLSAMTLHPLSPHVQPVAAGYSRERRVQRHACGQQAASPPAIGSDPECTFAPVPPGPPAAGGPAATPALLGETLQGTHVLTHTHTHTHIRMCTRSHTDIPLCV